MPLMMNDDDDDDDDDDNDDDVRSTLKFLGAKADQVEEGVGGLKSLLCPGDDGSRPDVKFRYWGFAGGPHEGKIERHLSVHSRGQKLKGEPVFVWDNGDCPLGYFTHAMVTDDNVNFTFTEPHRNGVHHRFQLI